MEERQHDLHTVVQYSLNDVPIPVYSPPVHLVPAITNTSFVNRQSFPRSIYKIRKSDTGKSHTAFSMPSTGSMGMIRLQSTPIRNTVECVP